MIIKLLYKQVYSAQDISNIIDIIFVGSLGFCIDESLTSQTLSEVDNGNMNIIGLEKYGIAHLQEIAYVGNGVFGLEISKDSQLNIKEGRALTLDIPFAPIVTVSSNQENVEEFLTVDYFNGLVIRKQCFDEFHVKYQYFAHRNYPSVFVQEIQIRNLKHKLVDLSLVLPRVVGIWESSTSQNIKIQKDTKMIDHQVVSGRVELPGINKVRVVSVVFRNLPRILTLHKSGVHNFRILMTINYSKQITKEAFESTKEVVEKFAIDAMKKVLEEHEVESSGDDAFFLFRVQHTKVWNSLWQTGFYISPSKAENALNGKIKP